MTYKQIETSREIRLWIGQVIVPVAMGVTIIMTNPNAREAVKSKIKKVKESIQKRF